MSVGTRTLAAGVIRIAILTSLAGCSATQTTTAPAQPIALPVVTRIPIPIRLVFEDHLEKSMWEVEFSGSIHNILLGDALAANADTVARAAFEEVAGPVARGAAVGDATRFELSAALTGVSRTFLPRDAQETTVRVEWRLADPAGDIVWAQAVAATAVGESTPTGQEQQVAEAIEAVFQESFVRMTSAPAIRALASH